MLHSNPDYRGYRLYSEYDADRGREVWYSDPRIGMSGALSGTLEGAKRMVDRHVGATEEELSETLDLGAYGASLSAPTRARAEQSLASNVKSDGRIIRRIDLIDEKLLSGYRVVSSKGGRRLQAPDGRFLTEKQLTKFGLDYAMRKQPNPGTGMQYAVQEVYSTGRGSGVIVSEKLRGPYTVTVVVGDKQASRKIKMRAEARAYLRKKLGPLRKAKNPGKVIGEVSAGSATSYAQASRENPKGLRYRINYGQGQVHYVDSRDEGERLVRELGPPTYLQFKDPETGDWFKVRSTKSRENPLNRYYLRRADGAMILYRGRPYMTGSRGTAVAKARTISHKSKSQVNVIRVEPDGYEETVETIGSSRNPSNTNAAYDSQRLYDRFHGRPSTKTTVVATKIRSRDHLTELGPLTKIKVHLLTGKRWEKTFDPRRDQIMLCSSPDGLQLYFVDGNQAINLRELGMGSREWKKDSMVLGILTEVTYRTEKGFDKFQLTDYYHELGEETGMQPLLIYDTINDLMSVSGGQYQVRPEGIVN